MAAMDRAVSAIAAAVATSADEQDIHLPIRLAPAQSGFRISHKTLVCSPEHGAARSRRHADGN